MVDCDEMMYLSDGGGTESGERRDECGGVVVVSKCFDCPFVLFRVLIEGRDCGDLLEENG